MRRIGVLMGLDENGPQVKSFILRNRGAIFTIFDEGQGGDSDFPVGSKVCSCPKNVEGQLAGARSHGN
jgi:hypothetical protein